MTDLQQKEPLVLVDGSSYLYRAFHALPPLTNSQGYAHRRCERGNEHASQTAGRLCRQYGCGDF